MGSRISPVSRINATTKNSNGRVGKTRKGTHKTSGVSENQIMQKMVKREINKKQKQKQNIKELTDARGKRKAKKYPYKKKA